MQASRATASELSLTVPSSSNLTVAEINGQCSSSMLMKEATAPTVWLEELPLFTLMLGALDGCGCASEQSTASSVVVDSG